MVEQIEQLLMTVESFASSDPEAERASRRARRTASAPAVFPGRGPLPGAVASAAPVRLGRNVGCDADAACRQTKRMGTSGHSGYAEACGAASLFKRWTTPGHGLASCSSHAPSARRACHTSALRANVVRSASSARCNLTQQRAFLHRSHLWFATSTHLHGDRLNSPARGRSVGSARWANCRALCSVLGTSRWPLHEHSSMSEHVVGQFSVPCRVRAPKTALIGALFSTSFSSVFEGEFENLELSSSEALP